MSLKTRQHRSRNASPLHMGKGVSFDLEMYMKCVATETRSAVTFCVFLHLTAVELLFHLLLLLTVEKRHAKKRLSQDQAKDDDGQQPEVNDTDGPTGLQDLSPPPKVPVIQPKPEPEEQESK